MSFTDIVGRYQLARSEGLVLRYLTDAYRTLRHTVPEVHRPPELDEIVEWLGETVRQTDSSLLDEWEALVDPAHGLSPDEPIARPPRRLSETGRAFDAMIRNALWARVAACARDDLDALARLEADAAERVDPPREVIMTRAAWDSALEEYYDEHESVLLDADARGPSYLVLGPVERGEPVGVAEPTAARVRRVVQTLRDPADHRDWVIEGVVDCDASDAAGELVLATSALRRL